MSDMQHEAVHMQTQAAETRRKMTERYHMAVVRGRHPRSFPRNSALWIHANNSKERSVRLHRGQSLASVVGGDPSIFSSLSFQGSSFSAAPGQEDPSYHPQHSAWSSQQGGSLDLGAPPGTAGMGMFPPVYPGGSAPGTQESGRHHHQHQHQQQGQEGGSMVEEAQRISQFQMGRRMSVHRVKAAKANAKIQDTIGQQHRSATGMAAEASAKSRRRQNGSMRQNSQGSTRSITSSTSITPAEAVAQVRQQTTGSNLSSAGGGGRHSTAATSASSRSSSTRRSSPMGLGANLSGVNMSNDASAGAKALSPYEEDTVPEFTDSSQVSVFYGSTIALQMSDGRFLSVEEETGQVTCRHWPNVEDIGIRQESTHPNDPRSVPARCLLTLTNLKDVHSSDPIHYGDPVYLVLTSGSGIPDWKHGALVGAQIEHAPDLGTVGLSRTGSCIRNPEEVNDDIGEVHAMPTVIPHAVMNKKAVTAKAGDNGDTGKGQAKPIWLPGPVTPQNETGWYSKKDPLYDKLWKDRNRVPIVVGRWVFMPNEESKVGRIRRNKASKEARSAIDKGGSGEGSSSTKGGGTIDKIELNNLDNIYLEQDWFYLSQDPDDVNKTCLRQLPGTNRDGAEIAKDSAKKKGKKKGSPPPSLLTKAGKRRDPPMPGDVVERRGLWKIRVVGVNNSAPGKGGKGGTSRQDAIERTLYKARKQLKRSSRMREGKNRTYQNGTLKGGQDFSREIRNQQRNTDLEVDDRYLSHEEDKMHQLADYFEARYAATTEHIPLFDPPDPASLRMKQRLAMLQQQGAQFGGGGSRQGSRLGSRMSSRWSLDGGGSALLPVHEAAIGLGGHYLQHSLSLHNLSSATKVPVDLYPEDRLISSKSCLCGCVVGG